MKQNANQQKGTIKRLALAMMLVLACVLLTSCYTDPDDRAFDDGNFNLDPSGVNFQTVITNTPNITATPTPSPTVAPAETPDPSQGQSDWSDWTWGNTTVTNPPSNVVTSAPNNIGGGTPIQQPTNQPGSTFNDPGNPSGNTPSGGNTSSGGSTSGGSSSGGSSSGSSSSGSSSSSSTLKMGSTGEAVRKLQNRLKELKYYSGVVDGDYGQGTYNAVKAFQANNNLNADGVAGPKTLEAVYSYYAVPSTATGSGNGGGGTSSRPSSGGSSGGNTSGNSGGSSSGSSNANAYTNGKTDIYLDFGDTGSQVKILQNRLIVLGYLTGTANGEFEATTEAAVIAFQKRNGLGADGVAGPGTLTKLYSSSAKKADSVVANLGSLKEGSQGAAVRALQKNLRTLGYYTGSVDGDYGSGTVAAVTAFQAANGLTADGIAGNGTQNAILIAINGGGSSGAGSSSGSGSGNNGSSSPVTYGSTATSNGYSTISASNGSSANVSAVQSALSAKGYYSGQADGDFGSGTQSAVESFQRSQGLRVTGMAGPTTQRLLFGGTPASGSYSKLERGSSGSRVKTLQYALYELKYYDGNITGQYDEATENAVMLFQDCNGLEIDGVAGQMTQQLLYSSSAVPCNK